VSDILSARKAIALQRDGQKYTVQLRETGAGLAKQSLTAFSTKSFRPAGEVILRETIPLVERTLECPCRRMLHVLETMNQRNHFPRPVLFWGVPTGRLPSMLPQMVPWTRREAHVRRVSAVGQRQEGAFINTLEYPQGLQSKMCRGGRE